MAKEFKKESGFSRLFIAFHDKYESYGYLKRRIVAVVNCPTLEERNALGGLTGSVYPKGKDISISVEMFEAAVEKTKYGTLLQEKFMETLLQVYFEKPLMTKKEQKLQFEKDQTAFFSEYLTSPHPQPLQAIMQWSVKEEHKGNRFLLRYKQGAGALKRNLDILSKLFCLFPLEEPMYLPVFASMATHDPHTLDMDRAEGKLLIYALQVLLELETGEPMNMKLNAEDVTELFLHFNILRDDLSNYVTLFNMEGTNHDGSINALLQATSDSRASINYPLKEVLKLKQVQAKGSVLFMLENSSVSSYLMDQAVRHEKDISILSGNGMLRVATLKFLDLYVRTGGLLWYAGDYDPEGLGIAQRLIDRYGEAVKLWNYTEESYLNSLSDEEISVSRLKQLEQITSPQLTAVKAAMLKKRRAGYQENVLVELLRFENPSETAA